MERREPGIMNENQRDEHNLLFSQKAAPKQLAERLIAGASLLRGRKQSDSLGDKGGVFRIGASRLYLAIVNRAILDALENGKNSRAAQRWLLSKDFDKLEALFR